MTDALELRPTLTDGDLAIAAAGGDRQAFAEIYDRYADRLYDFCVGLLGDRDAAADCVQDAFCVAATDLGGLREPDRLRPWLYSIARNHAMRRLRHRYREEVSDEVPDMAAPDASPETLAGQSELALLVAEAAGGLSDRDRELLDLSYRHGLDGPELAEALGVTLTSANTRMFRLRQTVERCLGALLVARGARTDPHACPALAPILKGWDGQFTVLMRKRMARHIDSCRSCEMDQRRRVNPVALLGGAPVFIPVPEWLRRQTLDRVELTSASSTVDATAGDADRSEQIGPLVRPHSDRRPIGTRIALAVIPLLFLGLSITWFTRHAEPVVPVVDSGRDTSEGAPPVLPGALTSRAEPTRPQPAPPARPAQPAMPTQQTQTAPAPASPTPVAEVIPRDSAPVATPREPQSDAADLPDWGPRAVTGIPEVDTGTTQDPRDTGTAGGSVTIANPRDTVTGPGADTATATDPKDTSKPQLSVGIETKPNLNLNPKDISPFPQTSPGVISIPKVNSPNLNTPNLNISPNKPQPNTATDPKTQPKGTTSGST